MSIVLDGTLGVTTNAGTLISATTIGVGAATPSASGAGVTFPATQSASTDANTLDDYEEGTWTPIDGSGDSLSFTGVSATYTKVGRMVTCLAQLTYPATASATSARIAGVPFTSANVNANRSGGVLTLSGAAGSVPRYLFPEPNNTGIPILTSVAGAATNANCSSGQMNICLTFFV